MSTPATIILSFVAYLLLATNYATAGLLAPRGTLGYVLGQSVPATLKKSLQCSTAQAAKTGPTQRDALEEKIYHLQLSEDRWCQVNNPPPVAGQAVSFASITIDKGCVRRIDVEFKKTDNKQETSDAIVAMLRSQYGKETTHRYNTGDMRWAPVIHEYSWLDGNSEIIFSEAKLGLIMSTRTRCSSNYKLQQKIMELERRINGANMGKPR